MTYRNLPAKRSSILLGVDLVGAGRSSLNDATIPVQSTKNCHAALIVEVVVVVVVLLVVVVVVALVVKAAAVMVADISIKIFIVYEFC